MDPKHLPESNNPWASHMYPARDSQPSPSWVNDDPSSDSGGPPSYDEATALSHTHARYQHETHDSAHRQYWQQRNDQQRNVAPTEYGRGTSYGGFEDSYSGQNLTGPAVPSSSRSSRSEDESINDSFMQQALDFTHHPPAMSSVQRRLARPVAVPQVAAGLGLPFARAYSPALLDRDISITEFLEFVDNLNVVSIGSPPLQILDLAGGVVGMVPHHIPQLVGNAVSWGAKLGSAGISKGRSTLFLNKANSDFFAPRGLKVELITGKALKVKLGLHPDTDLVLALSESSGLNVQQRRMKALAGYISPLTFDVPPPSEQTNALEKMSAWKVQKQMQTSEKKALKNREKALEKSGQEGERSKADKDFEKGAAKVEREKAKVLREYEKEVRKGNERKAQRELDKDMQKLDREMEKAEREFGKEINKDREDKRKEDKELKQADKILWIFIEDL